MERRISGISRKAIIFILCAGIIGSATGCRTKKCGCGHDINGVYKPVKQHRWRY